MHWSRAILSFLAISLPLCSAHPVSASASLEQRSVEIASIPSIESSTHGPVLENGKTRRNTLTARNEVVELREYDVAFLDPKGARSKIYLIRDQKDLGKRPKSDPALKTTVAVKTSNLGPCFALAIVDDNKGGLLGHFSPPFCRWLANPTSVGAQDAAEAAFSKAALGKLLKKQYSNDLSGGQVYIVHGPSSDGPTRDMQEQRIHAILLENGIRDQTIARVNVPSHSGRPGEMDDATFAKKVITLEQQTSRRLLLKMGGEVIRS